MQMHARMCVLTENVTDEKIVEGTDRQRGGQ